MDPIIKTLANSMIVQGTNNMIMLKNVIFPLISSKDNFESRSK